MNDTDVRGLNDAPPPAFVNDGDALRRRPGQAAHRSMPKGAPRREPPLGATGAIEQPAASMSLSIWQAGFATASRLQEAWQVAIAALAREQMAFLAQAGRDAAEAGRALSEEPDLHRRLELAWSHGQRRFELTLDASARMIEVLSASGREVVDLGTQAATPERHKRAG